MFEENPYIDEICIRETEMVEDVLTLFATHKPGKTGLPAGIALVVNGRRELLGLITHGDLSRALETGTKHTEPADKIMNADPFFVVEPKDARDVLSAIVEKLREEKFHKDRLNKTIIVDRNKKVLDVIHFFDLWQQSDVDYKHIGIVGLGFVGLTLGLTLADLGFRVKGCDVNPELMEQIRQNQVPFHEEGLPQLLKEHLGNRFTLVDSFEGNNNCDVYFIAVGTPLDQDQKPQMDYVITAAESLGKVLKKSDLFVLRSTVPLGITRNVFIPKLEEVSGKKVGKDFFVAFAPERTVEGKALQELRTLPQVIGGINRASSNLAAGIFNHMTHSIHILDTLEEAEIVKLINNTYRDVTFGFANEMALICRKWGIDTVKVIDAANAGYSRSNVPRPSPGVGGYCLDKDPHILMYGAREKGHEPQIPLAARMVNKKILETVTHDTLTFLKKASGKDTSAYIMILGFAFKGKPATSDLRGSTTIELVRLLKKAGCNNLYGYDPIVHSDEIARLGVTPLATIDGGFDHADVVIIMNNHHEFEHLNVYNLIKKNQTPKLLFDTWALYDANKISNVPYITYRRL